MTQSHTGKKEGPLCEEARACIAVRDLDKALSLLARSLSQEPTAEAHYLTGVALYLSGNKGGAGQALLAAVALDRQHDRALSTLASLAFEGGDRASALQYTALAMEAAPDNAAYKHNLATIIGQTSILLFSPELKTLILQCLEDDGVEPVRLAGD